MLKTDFVPDRRDEEKTLEPEKRSGMDRRRFLRPSRSLKLKGFVFAVALFLVVGAIAALIGF